MKHRGCCSSSPSSDPIKKSSSSGSNKKNEASLSHFQGKSLLGHLTEARKRGALAQAEAHGTEPAGALSAGADSLKESAVVLAFLFLLFPFFSFSFTPSFIWIFGMGWILWKTGRSALLGWRRLARLHKAIEEERWEIEHNREEEQEELRMMYAGKGFSGEILDQIVITLMSDDNRLLQIMLEEELGLSLEIHEHPLKQAFGALLGSFIGVGILGLILTWFPPSFFLPSAFILVGIGAFFHSFWEKSGKKLPTVIWTLSLMTFALACSYFFSQWMIP